jgi:hypothetical protein
LQQVAQACVGFVEQAAEARRIAVAHRLDSGADARRFPRHMEERALFGAGEALLRHAPEFLRRSLGKSGTVVPEAKPPERPLAGEAALVVLVAHRGGLFRPNAAVGDQKDPARRHRHRLDADGRELDQKGAAFLRGEHRGVVHAAAARADEVFALGKNFHQLGEGGADAVGLEQRQRAGRHQRGG